MHKINMYEPEDMCVGRNPVLVYLHPGGWRGEYSNGGADSSDANFIKELVDYGVCVAIPAYSLSDDPGFVDGISTIADVAQAIGWLKAEGHTRIFLSGYSAGAHLALLYSLRFPGNVEKVVTIAAPSDLARLGPDADPTMQNMLNTLVAQFAASSGTDLRKVLSPVYRDPTGQLRTMYGLNSTSYRLLYNIDDDCVDYSRQGYAFYSLLRSKGFNVELVPFTDPIGKHNFVYRDSTQVMRSTKEFTLQGMLLAGPANPPDPIYYIDGYTKRWIPTPEIYEAAGFAWTDFIRIPQAALDSIPTGENFEL